MANQQKNENAAREHADYLLQLRTEFGQVDQGLTITNKLLQQEIDRVIKGGDGSKPIEIHRDNPMKLSTKLLIPIKEFPKVNFVGKLIGPGGANMKRLQHELGIRMAVYGRGSMRDKAKEEELRKEGGKKYGHLNDDLHVYMEINAPADQAYELMGRAISTIKPYFDPSYEDGNMPNMPHPQAEADPYGNGAVGRGRGRGRGAPLLAPGAPPLRGRPAAPAPRGAPPTRGRGVPARPAPQERAYAEDDYYGSPPAPRAAAPPAYAGYEADTSYEQDTYARPSRPPMSMMKQPRSVASEVQSFDYGHGSSGDTYEAPAQDTWERRDPYQSRTPTTRGRGGAGAAPDHRQHPYERPAARHPAPRY